MDLVLACCTMHKYVITNVCDELIPSLCSWDPLTKFECRGCRMSVQMIGYDPQGLKCLNLKINVQESISHVSNHPKSLVLLTFRHLHWRQSFGCLPTAYRLL